MSKEYKSFPAFITKVDGDRGIVEHIVAVMGNRDMGNDVIHPGAFLKTIQERGAKVRVLDHHRTGSISCAIGKPLSIREITGAELPASVKAQYPDATGGLLCETQFLMDTPEGAGAFARIKAGAIDEYSFGYDPIQYDYSKSADGQTQRNLRELRLWEYSPVLWGMNPATATVGAKAASGAPDLTLAGRDLEWDGAAAEGRVREWAGAGDAPNEKYQTAFFWYDADAPEDFGSYKLQFADVIDGELTAVPRGIFAVAAALMGSRGGVDLPEGDVEAVRARVAAYYKRMASEFEDDSIVAPWDKTPMSEDEPEEETDSKAGRVIAKRNAERLRQIRALLKEIEDDAGIDENAPESGASNDTPHDGKRAGPGTGDKGQPTPPTPTDDLLRLIEIEQSELSLID